MVTALLVHGRVLALPLAALMANVQTRLDGLLVRADGAPPGEQPKGDSFPVWAIIVIALLLILCLLPVCIIAILTLLGPAIGNVFDNVNKGI